MKDRTEQRIELLATQQTRFAYFEKSGLMAGHLRFRFQRPDKINPLHFVVAREALMAVLPFDGDVSGLNRSDLAAICRVTIEANARADL
jgi:hypothetical protein